MMTTGQMLHIIQRTSETFPELGEARKKAVLENYAAVDSLIKDSVFVKLRKNLPTLDRLKV